MNSHKIEATIAKIISSLPPGVTLVAAAKTRTVDQVQDAINGGVKILGYNYVQEAERMHQAIGDMVQWHLIGHLQIK